MKALFAFLGDAWGKIWHYVVKAAEIAEKWRQWKVAAFLTIATALWWLCTKGIDWIYWMMSVMQSLPGYLGGSQGAFGSEAIALASFLNYMFPLSECIGMFVAYWLLSVVLLAYRSVKTWLPGS